MVGINGSQNSNLAKQLGLDENVVFENNLTGDGNVQYYKPDNYITVPPYEGMGNDLYVASGKPSSIYNERFKFDANQIPRDEKGNTKGVSIEDVLSKEKLKDDEEYQKRVKIAQAKLRAMGYDPCTIANAGARCFTDVVEDKYHAWKRLEILERLIVASEYYANVTDEDYQKYINSFQEPGMPVLAVDNSSREDTANYFNNRLEKYASGKPVFTAGDQIPNLVTGVKDTVVGGVEGGFNLAWKASQVQAKQEEANSLMMFGNGAEDKARAEQLYKEASQIAGETGDQLIEGVVNFVPDTLSKFNDGNVGGGLGDLSGLVMPSGSGTALKVLRVGGKTPHVPHNSPHIDTPNNHSRSTSPHNEPSSNSTPSNKNEGNVANTNQTKPADNTKATDKKKQEDKQDTTKKDGEAIVSDPVVITRGEYIETWDDFYIEATIPIHATRYYGNQFNIAGGPLGRNRISPFDVAFRVTNKNTLEYFDEGGNRIGFDRPYGIGSVGNAAFPNYRLSAPKLRHLRLRDRRIEKHFRQYKDRLYRLEKIEDLNGNSINFIRDKQGLLLEAQHSDGFSLNFENDEAGQRTSIKWLVDGGEAHLVTYHYDNFGNMLKADCESSFCITYIYDEKNRLKSWNDRTGRSKTIFSYNDEDRVIHTETTGPWNNDIFEYDRENRVSTYRPGGGEVFERFWYDENENILKEQTPIGAIKSFEYDGAGFKTSQQDEAGNTSKWQYDNAGNIINFTDAEGRWAHYAWNDFGSPNVVVDGEGNSWKYDHDGAGNVISAIDAEGHETRIEWTQAGQPSIIHFADGGKEQRFYDQHHRLIEIILTNGGKVRLERDIFGRVISEQNPDGSLTKIFYDHSKGKEFYQPTRIERPDGSVIERKFDAEGHVSYVKDAQGRQWTYHYGPFDLLLGMQEPGGGQLSLEYDVLKRLTCVKDALQRQWHLERDAAGRIIHECDFASQNFYYHYDDVGNVIKRINADNSFIEYSYDKTGLLLLEKAFSAQGGLQETTSFNYDGRQLLKRAENGSSVIAITRDKNGRIIQEGCNGRKITSQFDAMGRRISYQIGQNLTKFYHDPLGSLTQMVIGNHKPMDFQYDIMGRETQRQSHSGFALNQSYDALGLLTSQEAGFALSTLGRGLEGARAAQLRGVDAVKAAAQVKRDYSWNKAFEPLSVKDQRWGDINYCYDDNGQITKASSSDGRVEQFNYDPARNITGFSDENNLLSHWQQAKGGRITDAKGANGEHIALEYDECNRVIKRIVTRNGFRPKIWHYQWDAKDKLIGCKTPTGQRWTYHYDPFGRRIFKINASIAQKVLLAQSSNITELEKNRGAYHEDSHQRGSGDMSSETIVGTAYLWDGDTIAEEAPLKASGDADWNNATKWHYEPDTFRPIAKETANGELFYIVNDHLGTPREMFIEDGKLVWAAQYRTWGAIHKIWQADNDNDIRGPYPPPIRGNLAFKYDTVEIQAAQTCPIRFQGQWEDAETGLYYNRYRYYDPLAAQYISPDPIGLAGGLRSNGYVHNPNTWIDPLGLIELDTPNYRVYHIRDKITKEVAYVGITNDMDRRMAEHIRSNRLGGNFEMVPASDFVDYGVARGYEQADIDKHGTLKTNERGTKLKFGSGNRARSYAENREDPRAEFFKKHEAERAAYHAVQDGVQNKASKGK